MLSSRRAALLLASLLGQGCGYTSSYVPPADGRARAVWRENNVVPALAASPGTACTQEIERLTGTTAQGLRLLATGEAAPPTYRGGPTYVDGYWVPRYYGPPIVVVRAGVAPRLWRPPLFMPAPLLALRTGAGTLFPGSPSLSALSLFSQGDSGKALAYLAVLALIVLPIVDLWLALDDPESPTRSGRAIDFVNAYNDLARWPGSPCFEGGS